MMEEYSLGDNGADCTAYEFVWGALLDYVVIPIFNTVSEVSICWCVCLGLR